MENIFQGAYYILNSDNKLELHLKDKDAYSNLPYTAKADIRSCFVWGGKRGAWVSRAKGQGIPYKMLKYSIPVNEVEDRKQYADQREQFINKSLTKAERYDRYAQSREKQAETLQSEFNRLRKDWSWLTQPNVNTSAGRAFTNSRNRVMDKYIKSFDSLKIASNHREKARQYQSAATESELKNESYLINRVKEGRKSVRLFSKFQEQYKDKLEKIDEQPQEWQVWLQSRIRYYETEFEKLDFYYEALQELANTKIESGEISHIDVDKRAKRLKKEFKDFLKQKYGVDLLIFRAAFGQGVNKYYYIKTSQPLPARYHSGWAADNAAQVKVKLLIEDIDAYNNSNNR